MKRTIFYKIFSGYVIVTILLSIFILLLSIKPIKQLYVATLTSELANHCKLINQDVWPLIRDNHITKLDSLIKNLGNQTHRRITVISPSGDVMADSSNDPDKMTNHRTRPEIVQALQGKTSSSFRFSSTLMEEMLYVATPVKDDTGRIVGVIRFSIFAKEINGLIAHVRWQIIRVTLGILVIALALAFFLSHSLSSPIRQLRAAAQKVASGDFTTKVRAARIAELDETANSFNHMTEQVQTLFTELKRQRQEIETIVSSVQEALFAFDRDGRIKLGNESFKRICGQTNIAGKFYWEVFRFTEFEAILKQVQETKSNKTEEITIDGNIYLCSITYLPLTEEYIVLMHDITQIRNLEKMKKDLVANVSHELRTPLTAIKGFVETLEETADSESRRYLEIIQRHSDRLINIVEDLLSLSKLEAVGILQLSKIDIADLLTRITRMFEQRIKEKGLHLKLAIAPDAQSIDADLFKIEQVFVNLIDNAIKYTEKGEILITANGSEKSVIIEIKDTGIGIPKEHLPRIFERFYVVDKSRSKKMGGTGLGLSIVKHIVLLHKGTIHVESTLGIGSRFIITLPKI